MYNIRGDKMTGLYIHIPFCKSICAYCDFYKMVASNALQEKTIDYIIKELDKRKVSSYEIDTIYIGGGSPGSLDESLSIKLFSAVLARVDMTKIKEFTIELNPLDITLDYARLLKKYGVNRVSIGVETFNENTMKKIGRNPFVNFNEIKEKITILNECGINNINIDLIYGVYGTDVSVFLEDVHLACMLNITHLSCYSLILEEHTILGYQYKNKKFMLLDEDLEAKMYEELIHELPKFGFSQYELSNFAKDGYQSLHNLKYWKNHNYLAIGPSAAGFIDNMRYTNIKNLNEYFKGIDTGDFRYDECYECDISELKEITLMMNLRLCEGINTLAWLERFHEDIFTSYPSIKGLINDGLIIYENDYIKIPKKYYYISNYIIVKIIE